MSDDEDTNETGTATATGTATIGSLTDRYDMLAYLAEFIASAGYMAQNRRQMFLLNLLVDGSKQRFPTQSISGNASRVFVMKSNRLLESYNSAAAGNILPETVAVKMRRNKNSGGGEDLAGLKSLATELRILTDSNIQAHPNIIKLLGSCWQYADDECNIISPVMLYDTTTLGDLETYHDNHKDLSLGVQLQLGLNIARGVAGLHEAGIIHCDLKPKNILIFGQDDKMCPVVPKIIDFDIAVLHQDVEAYINPPRGTELWRSPEQRDNHKLLHRDDLFKIDVFSLGLVLLNLFTSNFLSRLMTSFDLPAMQEHFRCGLLAEFKSSGNLACSVLMLLSDFANISGPEGSNDVHVRFRLLWYRATRILVKCLRGNLKSRLWNISEIVKELEKLLDEVQQLNLLSYTNPDVKADGSHKGSLRIAKHEGPHAETDNRIDLLLETFEDMIKIYQPHVVRLAHERGISIDLVASLLTKNGSLRSDRTDKKAEVLKVPVRTLRKGVSADAVVKISNNLGTFSMLPPTVLKVVMENLASTYASKKQRVSRRAQAAFEYAIGSVSLLISEDSRSSGHDIAESLAMLQYAAEHGHHNAQFLAPWLETTLRRKSLSSQVEPQTINRLANGVLLGSRIAMLQLKNLDPVAYNVAIQSLRTRYRGLGMFTEPEVANWATPAPYNADPESPERLWISSSRGDAAGLRQIAGALSCKGRGELPFWLNEAYFDDFATPLLEACRSGHKEAARLLLEYGADASMVDRNGVSPLHFLSSFEPNDMLGIAQELLKHGAILDSWTLRPCYNSVGGAGLDKLYGQVSGTPLLWAVAADCIDAVRVLLEMGADPFAIRPPDVVANSHFYPVLLAARFHQSRILALLLSDIPKEEIAKNLNSREDETEVGVGGMSPLGYACFYGGGQVLARMLLHGPNHIERCAETINLLLDLGADPVLTSSQDHGFSSAFGISARSPQTYALRSLLQWNHCAHKPDLEEWIQALVYSAYWNGQAMFDELIEIDVNLGDKYSWSTIAREVSARTNNTHYIKAIASKQKGKSDSQGKNYTFAFVAAVTEGNFDTARTVYEQHKSDIDLIWAQPLDDNDQKRKISILGQLIRIAKMIPNRTPNLAFFLDLVGPRHQIFERVIEAEDGSWSINALQFVVIYAFHQDAISAGTPALRALLKHFRDPIKHLACQGSQGRSLLHQAVHDGNYAALDVLLTTDGMNFDLRNHHGMTAFDVCLTRWEDSSRDTNFDFNNALKKGRSRAWAEEQWQTATERMMRSMEEKGASKYGDTSHCSKRISESEAIIITLLPTGHIARTKHKLPEKDAKTEVKDLNDYILQHLATVPVGRVCYLKEKRLFQQPQILAMVENLRL